MTGAQIGIINVAGKATGAQIGVINVAKEMDGAPIGVINIIGDGMHSVAAWTSETTQGTVGVKLGSQHVFTILGVGGSTYKTGYSTLAGGIGGHKAIGPAWLEVDGPPAGHQPRPALHRRATGAAAHVRSRLRRLQRGRASRAVRGSLLQHDDPDRRRDVRRPDLAGEGVADLGHQHAVVARLLRRHPVLTAPWQLPSIGEPSSPDRGTRAAADAP
jgi:hypothetical protein